MGQLTTWVAPNLHTRLTLRRLLTKYSALTTESNDMSDNKYNYRSKVASVYGAYAFGNPLDNNGEPVKHSKEQVPVKYYVRDIENDLGDGGPDLVQIEAIAMQYNVIVSAYLPVEHSDLLRLVADVMIRARLSKKGLQTNNIELVDVDAGEDKDGDS